MTTARACLDEHLTVGADGRLRLAPWAVPRNVVDVTAQSTGDTTKLLETTTLPGRLLIDRRVKWINDTPIAHTVRIVVVRRFRKLVTSNPNAVQFRDRWSSIIVEDGDLPAAPDEPSTADTLNGQVGVAGDIGTNTVAEPLPGVFTVWWGTGVSEEFVGPVPPRASLEVWYRQYVWTPPPFSDNANKNSPAHEAHAGWARIALHAYPSPGRIGAAAVTPR